MAYYAQDATKQAVQAVNGLGEPLRRDGIGAYYAYDATHEAVEPVNGLALSGGAELADDAIRGVVGARKPVMIAGEWAVRTSDISWEKAAAGSAELTLIPIADRELARVRELAFGHEAVRVGVLMPELLSLRTVEAAFDGTPYALERLIAVYDVTTAGRQPPLFLALGVLRDAADEDGGSHSMQGAARSMQGVLVYPIALPAGTRPPALPPVSRVLAAEAPPQSSVAGLGFTQKGVLGSVGKAELAAGAVGVVGVIALGYLLSRSG